MKTNYQSELVGQIMDKVEDFMEEREGTTEPILIGSNYDKLSRSVTETLQNWDCCQGKERNHESI